MAISIKTAATKIGSTQTSLANLILQAKVGGTSDSAGGSGFKRAFSASSGALLTNAKPYWNMFSEISPGTFRRVGTRLSYYLKNYYPEGSTWVAGLDHFNGYNHYATKGSISSEGSIILSTSSGNLGFFAAAVTLGNFNWLYSIDWEYPLTTPVKVLIRITTQGYSNYIECGVVEADKITYAGTLEEESVTAGEYTYQLCFQQGSGTIYTVDNIDDNSIVTFTPPVEVVGENKVSVAIVPEPDNVFLIYVNLHNPAPASFLLGIQGQVNRPGGELPDYERQPHLFEITVDEQVGQPAPLYWTPDDSLVNEGMLSFGANLANTPISEWSFESASVPFTPTNITPINEP